MTHDVRYWPATVYPGEVTAECPEAMPVIDTLIERFRRGGPSPDIYRVKNLGSKMGGLWQVSLKVRGRQIRVLYAPYGTLIVLFRIHKKSSPQEQSRAYERAKGRKQEYERIKSRSENNGGTRLQN